MPEPATVLSLVDDDEDSVLKPRTLSKEEQELLGSLVLVDADSSWFIERWLKGYEPELTFTELLFRETKEGVRIKRALSDLREELRLVSGVDSLNLFEAWVRADMQ